MFAGTAASQFKRNKTISLPRSTLMFDGLDIPLKTLIFFCTQLSLFLSLPQFSPSFCQVFPTPYLPPAPPGPTLSTSAAVPCCASKSFMPSSAWVIMPPAQFLAVQGDGVFMSVLWIFNDFYGGYLMLSVEILLV